MPRIPKLSTPGELAELASMARNRAPGLSDVTLRVQTDLLISGGRPQREMERAYEALLTALLPRIEPRTVDIVLGKLVNWAHLTDGLAAVIRQHRPELVAGEPVPVLASDQMAANTPVVEQMEQPVAPDRDALRNGPVTSALPEMASAPGSRATSSGDLQQLVTRARRDTALARLIVAQDDLPALALAPLFAHADLPAKARILAAVQKHLSLAPIAAPPRATGPEIEHLIALTRTQPADAAAMMAAILDGGETLAQEFERDPTRTLTTLATVAMGFEPEETIRLLLVAGDEVARSTSSIMTLADLARSISSDCALRLVAAISGTAVAKPVGAQRYEHIPQAAPTGISSRPGQPVSVRPARKMEWAIHLNKPARPAS